jgi:MFS family permease
MTEHPSAIDAEKIRPALSGYARYVFWVMCSISFLNYLDRYVLVGASTTIGKELGIGLDGIGYIASAFLIVYTIFTLPLGFWADRTKRKNVVTLCVSVWSIATVGTALATNFGTLFLGRMVLGVGEAGYFPAGTALMSDYIPSKHRSRVMSWWSCAELFGILGGYAIGGALAGLFVGSWRLAFLFTGIPGLIAAYFAWRMREPRRNQADEKLREGQPTLAGDLLREAEEGNALSTADRARPAAEKTSFAALFRQILQECLILVRIRTLVALIIMQVFAFFVLGAGANFLPIYLQQKNTFGMSPGLAGLYSGGLIVVAGLVGAFLGGYLSDLLNRRYAGARVLVCGLGFLICAPAFAVAVSFQNITVFTIFFAITAMLLRVYNGPCSAATQDVVPARLRASALALSLLFAHLFGDAFAPSLVGTLATVFDPTSGHQHFLNGVAGLDLSTAFLITCTPALVIAGIVGVLGARWMASDVAAAELANRETEIMVA